MTDPTDLFGRTTDGTPIPGRVRRSTRAHRISIIVHADRVDLVVPARAPLSGPSGALAFLQTNQAWVTRAWERARNRRRVREEARPPPLRYEDGSTVLVLGQQMSLAIREGDVTRPQVEVRDGLLVTVPLGLADAERQGIVSVAVRTWAWTGLLAESRRLGADMAARLGLTVADVCLSRDRSRWGSCNARGVIRVNGALASAPPDLLEYLVAHEVAHLRCRGHGPRFYATLARLVPDWEERRRRLRAFEKEHPFLLR